MGLRLKHIFLGCLLSLIVQISYCIHVANNDYSPPHYCKACSSISSSVDSQSTTPKHEDLIEIPAIPIVSDRFHNAIKPTSIQYQPQLLQIDTSAFKSCGCKTSPQPQVEYESQVPSAPAKSPQSCTCPNCLNSTRSTPSTRQFVPYSYPEIQQLTLKSQPVCSCASSQLSSGLPSINKLLPSSSASASGNDCGCSSVSSNIPSQSSTLPPPPPSNYLPQPIAVPENPAPCSCSRSLPQQSRSRQLTPSSLLMPPFKYLPQYSPLALSPIILPQQPWNHPYFMNGRPLILPTLSPCQLNALKSLQSHGYANEIPSLIQTDTDSESLLKAYKELDQSKYYAQDVSEGSEPDLSSASYNKYDGDH